MRRMILGLVALVSTVFVGAAAKQAPAPAAADGAVVERVRRLLVEVPLIDGHNDLPWQCRERVKNHLAKLDLRADTSKLDPPMHTDIPRLRRGGVGAQFWSVYVPVEMAGAVAVQAVLEQIDDVQRLAERYPTPSRSPARPTTWSASTAPVASLRWSAWRAATRSTTPWRRFASSTQPARAT